MAENKENHYWAELVMRIVKHSVAPGILIYLTDTAIKIMPTNQTAADNMLIGVFLMLLLLGSGYAIAYSNRNGTW